MKGNDAFTARMLKCLASRLISVFSRALQRSPVLPGPNKASQGPSTGCYFTAKRHGRCGVYRLIAHASEGELTKPATLSRICGQDTTGTLYIGEAKSLSIRLNQDRERLHRRKKSHGAINTLRQIPVLNYPRNKRGIALLFIVSQTRMIEEHLIYAYINSFGEMPP